MRYGHTVNGTGGTGEGPARFTELGAGEPPLGKDGRCDRPTGAGDETYKGRWQTTEHTEHTENGQIIQIGPRTLRVRGINDPTL